MPFSSKAFALAIGAFALAIGLKWKWAFSGVVAASAIEATVFRPFALARIFVALLVLLAFSAFLSFALAAFDLELGIANDCEHGLLVAITHAR